MTQVQALARFVERARFQDLSDAAMELLKIRVLDTLGVAIGALDAYPIGAIRKLTVELGGRPLSTLLGGGKSAPDRAAFFNGALSRYLDFMDSYLAKGETCHPSDNIGAVLAAAEMRDASGVDFLTASVEPIPPPRAAVLPGSHRIRRNGRKTISVRDVLKPTTGLPTLRPEWPVASCGISVVVIRIPNGDKQCFVNYDFPLPETGESRLNSIKAWERNWAKAPFRDCQATFRDQQSQAHFS